MYSFDDDHPLIKDAFADKFQALNSVIKQTEKGSNATETAKAEEASKYEEFKKFND